MKRQHCQAEGCLSRQTEAGACQFVVADLHRDTKDGAIVWVALTVSPTGAPGEVPSTPIAVVQDITERRRVEAERERLIHDLEVALASIKTLHGLLPICASCKEIRNDTGYWETASCQSHPRA